MQYPYKLQVLNITGSAKDQNGNFISEGDDWQDYSKCRDEVGTGRKIRGVDGESYEYTALVHMPKGVPAINPGTVIRVISGEAIRITGKVIHSKQDQLHTRIWL